MSWITNAGGGGSSPWTAAGNDIANHLWKFGRLPDFKYEKLDWRTQEAPLYTTSLTGAVKDDFSHAEEMFRFQEDARVSFAEILGHYPYDKSEEINKSNSSSS
jgi:hypothetical protein